NRSRLAIGLAGIAALVLVALAAGLSKSGGYDAARSAPAGNEELSPRLAKKLALAHRYSPGNDGTLEGESAEGGWAAQDWLEHSEDGGENGPPCVTGGAPPPTQCVATH